MTAVGTPRVAAGWPPVTYFQVAGHTLGESGNCGADLPSSSIASAASSP